MRGLTLDAGALIAVERANRKVIAWLDEALRGGLEIAVPAGALGQAFRDASRQVRLVRLLTSPAVEIVSLDALAAKSAGTLCGARGTSDVIDASVVLCARARQHRVVTSDPDDLNRLDPRLELLVV